jgi:PAS domain S-box-containing protein
MKPDNMPSGDSGTPDDGRPADVLDRRQMQDLLEAVFEGSHDAITLIVDGKFIDCNRRTLELFGYDCREDFLGLTPAGASPPVQPDGRDSRDAARAHFEKSEQQGFDQFEWIHRRRNGEDFHADVLLSTFFVGGRKMVQGTVRDISAMKRAEEEIRKLNEALEQRVKARTAELDDARRVALSMMQDADHQRQSAESALIRLEASTRDLRMLSRAIENSPAMVVITDEKACIQYVNPKFTEVTGYSAGEALGLNPRILKSGLHPPEFYTEMWATLADGRQWQGEFCNRKKNGELYWEFASIAPMKGPDGELMNYVAVKEDITERRRFIQELEEAKQAAESANQAKSAFLANMSHEIRTPMNAILGFSQLMQDDPLLTPAQRQHLDIINRSGGHLMALINDILEMSKIEAGRIALNPGPFDLRMLISDMELMFRLRAEAKHLQFNVERHGDIPDLVVADEGKVRQVLINLLGNALKFTEKGGIVLRVRVRRDEAAGLRLLAEVEDTGPGISEDELGKLFRPFSQAGAGLMSRGGTGLGLAISREFARLMNGDVTVTSRPGEGSVFRVDLAMNAADADASIRKIETRRVKKIQDGQPPCRVLIADDNEENRQLLFQMLGRVGFELQQAANGEDAVNAFDAWHPHLILMDMRMPVMDGYTAIRRIRASAGGMDVKIIAVTASAFADTRQEVFAIGADDFMGKPFREKELFWAIGHLLGVAYIYEDAPAAEPAPAPDSTPLPDVRSCLPDDLVRELRETVVNGDFDHVAELAGQVKTHDARLARKVRELAEHFDSQRLLELLGAGGV